jgi:SAM-dependent methyltransferase
MGGLRRRRSCPWRNGTRDRTLFTSTSDLYDKIYSFKDYKREVEVLLSIIRKYSPKAKRLLDVGCGTGKHLQYLKGHYLAEGVDLLPQFCTIARRRNPELQIYQGDMRKLDLPHPYDVVVCLFSSIGYVETVPRLEEAIRSMARALSPGGLLIIEPWFTPKQWQKDTVHALYVDEPGLKIARINTSTTVKGRSVMEMHYLVGTKEGTRHYIETHKLGLFSATQMKEAFTEAELHVSYDKRGLTGRGLYIGKRQEKPSVGGA